MDLLEADPPDGSAKIDLKFYLSMEYENEAFSYENEGF